MTPSVFRNDWISRILGGTLLGFTFSLGCSGLFLALVSGIAVAAKVQLAMWFVMPVWLACFGGCFCFSSGKQVWLWFGGANILVFGVLAVLRLF